MYSFTPKNGVPSLSTLGPTGMRIASHFMGCRAAAPEALGDRSVRSSFVNKAAGIADPKHDKGGKDCKSEYACCPTGNHCVAFLAFFKHCVWWDEKTRALLRGQPHIKRTCPRKRGASEKRDEHAPVSARDENAIGWRLFTEPISDIDGPSDR